jgi:hypothetical protein
MGMSINHQNRLALTSQPFLLNDLTLWNRGRRLKAKQDTKQDEGLFKRSLSTIAEFSKALAIIGEGFSLDRHCPAAFRISTAFQSGLSR